MNEKNYIHQDIEGVWRIAPRYHKLPLYKRYMMVCQMMEWAEAEKKKIVEEYESDPELQALTRGC